MNYVKRAIKSMIRQPMKNLIFLLLIFIIGNLQVGAIAVQQAVGNVNHRLRSQIPAVGTVDFDITNSHLLEADFLEKFGEPFRDLNLEEILQIADLPYVQAFEFSIEFWSHIQGWESFSHKRTSESTDWLGNVNANTTFGAFERVNTVGVSNASILAIESGGKNLVAGRTFTQEEIDENQPVILISQAVANLNDLTIGSTITLENVIFDDSDFWEYFMDTGRHNFNLLTYEEVAASSAHDFKVVGIFDMEDLAWEDGAEVGGDVHHFNHMQNILYLPVDWADYLRSEFIQMDSEHRVFTNDKFELDNDFIIGEWGVPTSVFLLHNPLDFEAFAQAAKEILPPSWIMIGFSDDFNFIFNSMDNINGLSEIILFTVSGASIIIVALLITLFMKEREKELGVYLALGEKKSRLYLQILLEIFMVAALGLTLSLFTGSLIGDQLSQNMLQNQMEEQLLVESDENWWNGANNGLITLRNLGLSHEISIDEVAKIYEINLDASTLGLIYGIGSATIFLATLAPLIYVTKISPKKVLL